MRVINNCIYTPYVISVGRRGPKTTSYILRVLMFSFKFFCSKFSNELCLNLSLSVKYIASIKSTTYCTYVALRM